MTPFLHHILTSIPGGLLPPRTDKTTVLLPFSEVYSHQGLPEETPLSTVPSLPCPPSKPRSSKHRPVLYAPHSLPTAQSAFIETCCYPRQIGETPIPQSPSCCVPLGKPSSSDLCSVPCVFHLLDQSPTYIPRGMWPSGTTRKNPPPPI